MKGQQAKELSMKALKGRLKESKCNRIVGHRSAVNRPEEDLSSQLINRCYESDECSFKSTIQWIVFTERLAVSL